MQAQVYGSMTLHLSTRMWAHVREPKTPNFLTIGFDYSKIQNEWFHSRFDEEYKFGYNKHNLQPPPNIGVQEI